MGCAAPNAPPNADGCCGCCGPPNAEPNPPAPKPEVSPKPAPTNRKTVKALYLSLYISLSLSLCSQAAAYRMSRSPAPAAAAAAVWRRQTLSRSHRRLRPARRPHNLPNATPRHSAPHRATHHTTPSPLSHVHTHLHNRKEGGGVILWRRSCTRAWRRCGRRTAPHCLCPPAPIHTTTHQRTRIISQVVKQSRKQKEELMHTRVTRNLVWRVPLSTTGATPPNATRPQEVSDEKQKKKCTTR